jgi:solute carrier family 35 protein F1/2
MGIASIASQGITCMQQLFAKLVAAGITSGVLAGKGINAPTTQSLLNYLLLVVVCGGTHMRSNAWRWKFSNPWHVYALLAFLDVEGNFLVTKVDK